MSGLQAHFEERSQSSAPRSCPVCGAGVMSVLAKDAAPYLTCLTSRESHFEWRPAAARELVHIGDVRETEVVEGEIVW